MAKITTTDGITIEGTTEEIADLMAKFSGVAVKPAVKKGDKVRIIGPSLYGADHAGEIGVFDGIDSDGDHSVIFEHLPQRLYKRENIELVTEKEAEADAIERQPNDIFKLNGRKPNEYRKGDIVRVSTRADAHKVAGSLVTIAEFKDTKTCGGLAWFEDYGHSITGQYLEPIAFVENRLDRN